MTTSGQDQRQDRELIAGWTAHLARDRRRSAHTVRAYVATAERLIGFLSEHRGGRIDAAGLATVDAGELRAFLAYRRAEGLGVAD
ncbi:site-specific integrase, partial [Sphingomonas bacterium]|uniref:site-specific integrase n=1 Tax=Sphingomonas bacterium TaxID=1895847 RepID=UPI00157720F6